MSVLTDIERRLIVESAFAGVNHGLLRQARIIMQALPELIPDPVLHDISRAILLMGLNEPAEAGRILARIDAPETAALKQRFAIPKQGV